MYRLVIAKEIADGIAAGVQIDGNLELLHAKVLPVNLVKHEKKQVVNESRLH